MSSALSFLGGALTGIIASRRYEMQSQLPPPSPALIVVHQGFPPLVGIFAALTLVTLTAAVTYVCSTTTAHRTEKAMEVKRLALLTVERGGRLSEKMGVWVRAMQEMMGTALGVGLTTLVVMGRQVVAVVQGGIVAVQEKTALLIADGLTVAAAVGHGGLAGLTEEIKRGDMGEGKSVDDEDHKEERVDTEVSLALGDVWQVV
jgi:hypothetical protein